MRHSVFPCYRAGRADRRGAVAVLFAILLILVVVAMVYAIDVSRMHLTRAELRAATDAAARAGTEALLRTEDDAQAVQAATRVAAEHAIAGTSLLLRPQDISLGRSYSQDAGPWTFVAGEQPYNAVRVRGLMTDESASGSVKLLLGSILGVGEFQPKCVATAAQANLRLGIVVESSGSMHAHDRWEDVELALLKLEAALNRATHLGSLCLVECKNDPALLVDFPVGGATIEENLKDINEAVAQIRLRQSRNLGGGLLMASDHLAASRSSSYASSRILFIGSGNHNNGYPPDAAARIAASRRQVIYSIVVGKGADRKGAMAEAVRITGGKQCHLDEDVDLDKWLDTVVKSKAIITIQ